MKAINVANSKDLPEVPTLMFEFVGTGGSGFSSIAVTFPTILKLNSNVLSLHEIR